MGYENNNNLNNYLSMLLDAGKDFSVSHTSSSTYVNIASNGLPIVSMEFNNVTNKLINILTK